MFNRKIGDELVIAFFTYMIALFCFAFIMTIVMATGNLSLREYATAILLLNIPVLFMTERDIKATELQHKINMDRQRAKIELIQAKSLPKVEDIEVKIDRIGKLFAGEIEKR